MKTKFTPGPWRTGGAGKVIIYAGDGFAVANATIYHGRQEPGESQANARLIAAAPDLLASMLNIRAMADTSGDHAILEEANEAIAKAIGE